MTVTETIIMKSNAISGALITATKELGGMNKFSSKFSLIARLEAAPNGSRELDAEIWWRENKGRAVYWNAALGNPGTLPENFRDLPDGLGKKAVILQCPAYTTSLDTARTLGGMLVYASEIGADGLPLVQLVFDTSTSPVIEYEGIGATLELSWCIAAMKEKLHE